MASRPVEPIPGSDEPAVPSGRTGPGYVAPPCARPAGGGRPGPEADRRSATRDGDRILDRVVRTPGLESVLALIRERVLEHTRLALGLPVQVVASLPRFAPIPALHPEETGFARKWVGRLLSDQNLLTRGVRQGLGRVLAPDRLHALVEEGTEHGLCESLEILHEVGALDEEAWELVCGLLAEYQRLLLTALPRSAPPDA